jgi:hypothetical protein
LLQTHDASTTPTPRNARLRASAGKNAIQPKLLIASLCSRILHQTKFLSHIPWTRETPQKPTSPTINHDCSFLHSFIPFLSTSLPTLTAVLPLSHQPHHSTCSSIDIFVTHSTDPHKPTSIQQLPTLLRCSHLPPSSQLPTLAFPRRMSSICSPNQV